MDFALSDEQVELSKAVFEFARDALNDGLEAHDDAGEFPRESWKKCAEFGLLGLPIPAEYGGQGQDLLTTSVAMEALGRGCRDNGLVFSLNAQMWACEMPILHFGTEEQKRAWLPRMVSGAAIGAHAITDLASFYVERPRVALVAALALGYNPPLLDILPMYVLFIAASPRIIEFGSRRGWGPLLAVSAALWLFAQLGGGRHVYESVARLVEWPVPYAQTGAFSLLAWQLLWLVGLRAGALKVEAGAAAGAGRPWPRALVFGALALAAVLFVMRHVTGQVPSVTHASLNALFDKWHLGPLRLANFALLAVLAVHWRGVFAAWAPRSMIGTLGRASLTVFTAHLVLCLAILATAGETLAAQASVEGAALVAGTLVTLYAVARVALAGGRTVRVPVVAAGAPRKVAAGSISGRSSR